MVFVNLVFSITLLKKNILKIDLRQAFIIIILTIFLFTTKFLHAWGYQTHISINYYALIKSLNEIKDKTCLRPEFINEFLQVAPAPDIKILLKEMPKEFHSSPEVVQNLIQLAKEEPWGLKDLIMALGWCAHTFSEFYTAHSDSGYPNTKITFPIPNSNRLNHQISEIMLDIIYYKEQSKNLRSLGLNLPVRLLEKSIQDYKLDKNIKLADKIRHAAYSLSFAISGVRIISEYLIKNRPELIEEIDQFYGDRFEEIEESIKNVYSMLVKHSIYSNPDKRIESLDAKDGYFVIPLNFTLSDKLTSFYQFWFGQNLKSDFDNSLMISLGQALINLSIRTPLLKPQILKLCDSIAQTMPGLSDQHKAIVKRFFEGLLLREDLTFSEIIEYSIKNIEYDSKYLQIREHQLKKLGLTKEGRKLITLSDLISVWTEIREIERKNQKQSWFWPFRPSICQIAKLREKSIRYMVYYNIDNYRTFLNKNEINYFLKLSQELRNAIITYKNTPWYNPFIIIKNLFSLNKISNQNFAIAKEKYLEFCRQNLNSLYNITNFDLNLVTQKQKIIQKINNIEKQIIDLVSNYNNTPIYNLSKRKFLDKEIKSKKAQLIELNYKLDLLEKLEYKSIANSKYLNYQENNDINSSTYNLVEEFSN